MNIVEVCGNIVREFQSSENIILSLICENKDLKTQNKTLIDNEKDLMSVSMIIATKNENTRLTNELNLLKKTITHLKQENLRYTKKTDMNEDNDSIMKDTNFSTKKREEIDSNQQLYSIKHKGNTYYLDESDKLYSMGENDEKGTLVGNRLFDKQKQKFKYVLI
jgi:hypothetical protein